MNFLIDVIINAIAYISIFVVIIYYGSMYHSGFRNFIINLIDKKD